MKRTLTIVCGIAVAALLAPVAAQAEMVILVDFGNGTLATNGGTWNQATSAGHISNTYENLSYSDGTASEVDLVSNAGGSYGNGSQKDWSSVGWDSDNSNGDYFLYYGSGAGTLTFLGLDASKKYAIELISSIQIYDDVNFSVNSGAVTVHNPWTEGHSTNNGNTGTEELLTWSDISPVDGKIVLTMTMTTTGSYSGLNAIRLAEVPEPATMGLLGLGFAGMAALRRRRRNK